MGEGTPAQTPARVFRSRHQPGGAPPATVYGGYLIRTLGLCMIPLMLGATAAALQARPALPYLVWGFPPALLLALGWTHYRLRTLPAEIRVSGDRVSMFSVWDCLQGASSSGHHRVLDLKVSRTTLEVTIDRTPYTLARRDWPEAGPLLDALRRTRDA